jgi:tetratricopeptide (TPR) repeat protein
MRRLQLVSQGSLSRMIKAADESWERGDYQQCFELQERASRLDPGNPKMQLYLGQRYGLRYNYAAAERCFEQAVRIAPHKTETLAIAGRLSLDFGSHRMAEDYFRRAVEQKDAPAETFARLAEVYERLNRTEDATRLADQALQLDDHCARARMTRARLYGRTGRWQEAEQILRSFLTTTDLLNTNDRHIQIRCHYELGKNLDQQGRYDEAMTAFLEAKALLLPNAKPLIAKMKGFSDRLNELKTNLSAEMLQRWFDCAPALQPSHRLAFLGGHPRSGTTLLEQVLDSHPDIVSVEETAIFLEDACTSFRRDLQNDTPTLSVLERAQTGELRQSRTNYFHSAEMFLGKPIGNRLLIEKNPSLTFMIPALMRVFPEIKLLIALRDPRDVCLSCFMQPFLPLRQGNSAYLTLESTVEEYVAMMSLWQTLAPLIKNPFLEVRYEDMVNDLESVARRTLDFLGVPWDARVLGFDEHARQKVVRSPTYADVTKPVHKGAVGRWRNYQKYLEPHLKKLEPFIKAFGYE